MGKKVKQSTIATPSASSQTLSAPNFPNLTSKNHVGCDVIEEDQIILLHDVFSMVECQQFIDFINAQPLQLTPPPKKGEAARVNHRISITSPQFAQKLFSVLEPHFPAFPRPSANISSKSKSPTTGTGNSPTPRSPHSLNSNIRLYKYTPGQHFGPHYDDSVRDPGTGAISEWTVLVYLSGAEDGVQGGETVFYKGKGTRMQEVRAPLRRGAALLHRHGHDCLLHEGSPVTKGIKYILRSDIMFKS